MSDPTKKTLQDLYAWSDRLTDDWLGLGERLRRYADAWKADVEELRAEVELLRAEQPQDPSICGEDGPITPEECARWLETKYARHGELEDRAAAQWLRRLCAEVERLTRERDDWAQKWHRVRAELAELKYPGMKGVIKTTGSPGETPEAHPQSSEKAGARSSEGPGSILGCTCILCEYHRSAEDIERKLRAEAGEGTCGE